MPKLVKATCLESNHVYGLYRPDRMRIVKLWMCEAVVRLRAGSRKIETLTLAKECQNTVLSCFRFWVGGGCDKETSYFHPVCVDFSLCRPSKIACLSPFRLTGEGFVVQISHHCRFVQCFSQSGKKIGSTRAKVSTGLFLFVLYFLSSFLPQVYNEIINNCFVVRFCCYRYLYM